MGITAVFISPISLILFHSSFGVSLCYLPFYAWQYMLSPCWGTLLTQYIAPTAEAFDQQGLTLKKKRGKLLVIGRENLRNWAHLGKDVKKSLWFKPGSPH